MAVVLIFRALIALEPLGIRLVAIAAAAGVQSEVKWSEAIWRRLGVSSESPAQLAIEMSGNGYTTQVTDFDSPFSLRLAQIHWGRNSGDAQGTDDAITTHHFVKLTGGVPADFDDAVDLAPIETAFSDLWSAYLHTYYNPTQTLKEIRWYAAGPGVVPPNPPLRVTTLNTPGTGSAASPIIPPQIAMSVTEKTSSSKHWGRFYLPGGVDSGWINPQGRFESGMLTAFGGHLATLYAAFAANGTPAVVYSAAKAIRPNKAGQRELLKGNPATGTELLPAAGARALAVQSLQLDDIPDVIRSRRWKHPLIRHVETLTP